MITTKSKKKITIAVIGVGRWGKNLIREFSRLSTVKYYFHSGSNKNSRWMQKHYPNIRPVKSYGHILRDPSVEAVVIATPINTHFPLAMKALRARKSVFVEKPIADSVRHANGLVREAKKQKATLFVGYTFAHHPILHKLRKELKNDRPVYASMEWNKYGTFNEDIVQNLLSHEASIGHLLFGPLRKIDITKASSHITDCDTISLASSFGNIPCDIKIDRTASFRQKSVLVVAEKNTWLWEGNMLRKFNRGNRKASLVLRSKKTPLEGECHSFIKAVSKKEVPVTDGSFGLQITRSISRIKPNKVC